MGIITLQYISVRLTNTKMRRKDRKIEDFILTNVESHSADIVALTADTFGISRQTAHGYVRNAVKNGKIISTGRTRSTRYFLAGGNHIEFAIKMEAGLLEDSIWARYVKPIVSRFPENIQHLAYYGFTEIFNNVIDHSEGEIAFTDIEIKNDKLCVTITDNGIGIFNKIKQALNLDSDREAVLHLSKGKFTTDPSNHTGEGIFFTSRMFDQFSIFSDDLFYTFTGRDWFLSPERKESFGKGTSIRMALSLASKKTPKEIMDQYADQEIGFHKTIVAVALSASPDDPHISRSQAKRLLMGVEKFKEVVLDFQGVKSVGPAFVDQIFRVFQNEHPEIKIQYLNATDEVSAMIRRGLLKR
jgi:anti-sigma regulatory factor (Ser/Thr protein kinase)